MMLSEKCGRPTKAGTPCRSWRIPYGVACHQHATQDERTDAELREMSNPLSWQNIIFQAPLHQRDYPACWDWPAVVATSSEEFVDWHKGRCAVCGDDGRRLVVDHCHDTGLVRGYLCRSCNVLEGTGTNDIFEDYRLRPPAVILRWAQPYWFAVPTLAPADAAGFALPDAELVDVMGPRPDDPALAAAYLARAAEGQWKTVADQKRDIWRDNAMRNVGL